MDVEYTIGGFDKILKTIKNVSLPEMMMGRQREYRSENNHGDRFFIGSNPTTRFIINDSSKENLLKDLPEILSTAINPQILLDHLTNDGGFIA